MHLVDCKRGDGDVRLTAQKMADEAVPVSQECVCAPDIFKLATNALWHFFVAEQIQKEQKEQDKNIQDFLTTSRLLV